MNLLLSAKVVLPICIYLLVGILAKKVKWIGDEGVTQTNRLVYKLFFPMLMFVNIYQADLESTLDWKLLGLMYGCLTVVFLTLILLVPRFVKSRPRQGSIIQGVFRANSILYALPIVAAIHGEENLGLASMCVAFVVPYLNVLCVAMLESRRGQKVSFKALMKGIISNPIIIGALLGLLAKVTHLVLPDLLETIAVDMSKMVTPIALILLGAGLKLGNIKKDAAAITVVTVSKLILVPAFFMTCAYLLGFRGVAFTTVFALSAVPTAVASFVLAKEMEADAPLAGEIVAFTSVLSVFTIFVWMLFLTGVGLIG